MAVDTTTNCGDRVDRTNHLFRYRTEAHGIRAENLENDPSTEVGANMTSSELYTCSTPVLGRGEQQDPDPPVVEDVLHHTPTHALRLAPRLPWPATP